MLQIISGKFFKSSDVIAHDAFGVAYSNLRVYKPIATSAASLEPADYSGAYVIRYRNQIEKDEGKPALLLRTGDSEIVDQFLLLCMFGLRVFIAKERTEVARFCASNSRQPGQPIPSSFIPRYFEREIFAAPGQTEGFPLFVNKVISLKRSEFEIVMRYLAALRGAIEATAFNVDLAYSMMVYAMEALTQYADRFVPKWDDYDQVVKERLDESFARIDGEVVDEIKAALLQSSHLRLQKRFVAFIESHLPDVFFTSGAPQHPFALHPSIISRALRNAYRTRSNFAHALTAVLDQIRIPQLADGEYFMSGSEPYLTIRGLFRVAENVIHQFVQRQDSVEKEDFDWRGALPGVVRLPVAPQYWVWQHQGIGTDHVMAKLNGLLEQLVSIFEGSATLSDLRELLAKYETWIPNSRLREKRAMVTTYWLYNAMVVPDGSRPGWESYLQQFSELLGECSAESLVAHLALARKLPWSVGVVANTFESYLKEKFNPRNLRMPRNFEISAMAEIAAMYLESNCSKDFERWMGEATKEAAGLAEWQNAIDQAKKNQSSVDWSTLLGKGRTPRSQIVN